MKQQIKRLKVLAREAALRLVEQPDGRIILLDGEQMVTWWPHSRRCTAYADKAPHGIRFASPETVILMAKGEA